MDKLTETAPRRIWLQVDPNGDAEDRSEAFPEATMDMTWCQDSVGGQEVAYVRADLASPPPPPSLAAKLEGLVAKWRADVNQINVHTHLADIAITRKKDADELSALLKDTAPASVGEDARTQLRAIRDCISVHSNPLQIADSITELLGGEYFWPAQDAAHAQRAESEDAARYRWLGWQLIGRTIFCERILQAGTLQELSAAVDAARKAAAQQAGSPT